MKDSTREYLYKWHTRLEKRNMLNWLPDRAYIKAVFFLRMGYKLDLKTPKTFAEKLQWLKLYDRNPVYSVMADKYAAKEYAAEKIGKEHIIPTLGVWDSFEDIEFDNLPDSFVLKCSHDSGGLVIVRNKAAMDMKYAGKKINDSLKKNYYWHNRERHYKDIKPRIIAEVFMSDSKGNSDLTDYKFFCFAGEPVFCQVIGDRSSDETMDFFDMQWNPLDISRIKDTGEVFPKSKKTPDKPECFEKMKEIASKLSENCKFARIDLYSIQGKAYFGEITLFPVGGFISFKPEEWNYKFGSLITLPEIVK